MIYFLREPNTGLIKIGKTVHYRTRLSELIDEHGDLELLGLMPGYTDQERELHQQFAHLNIQDELSGREWFKPEPDLMKFIDRYAELTLPLPIDEPEHPQSRAKFRTHLHRLMKEHNVSRMDLVRDCYLSYPTVVNWESGGMQSVRAVNVLAVMEYFDVKFEELIYLVEEDE